MRHAIGSVVVALFALLFLHGEWAIRLLSPVFSQDLRIGLPGGPNVLLAVRGRTSGRLRQAPVAMMQLGDRRFVQAASTHVGWVQNLRASREAALTVGRRSEVFDAVELAPEIAGPIMHEALAPYPRSRLVRGVVGPTTRPPIGVLHYFAVRLDDTVDAYVAVAGRQPVFELRPRTSQDARAQGG